MIQLQLSAQAEPRVYKLLCTITDLARDETVGPQHLAEALQYKPEGMVS
jgi:magnesium chelatase family protein